MVLDFSNICRLCLINGQNEEMSSLFTEDQEEGDASLSGKVMALTSIEKVNCLYYCRITRGFKQNLVGCL
jgi:hypothetical protein